MAKDLGKPFGPPPDLANRSLHLASSSLHGWNRIHPSAHAPLHYSEDSWKRFSSPGCGILYAGQTETTCFWELFWDDICTRSYASDRNIPLESLTGRTLSKITSKKEYLLFDSTAPQSLRSVGANGACFIADYCACQQWAVALLAHPEKPDGILYRSSRDIHSLCVALFDRKRHHPVFETVGSLSDSAKILTTLTEEQVEILR